MLLDVDADADYAVTIILNPFLLPSAVVNGVREGRNVVVTTSSEAMPKECHPEKAAELEGSRNHPFLKSIDFAV